MQRNSILVWKRRSCGLLTALGAAAAGVVFALGFEPFGFAAAACAALVLLFFSVARSPNARRAAFQTFFFALGVFAFGLSWTQNSMVEHGSIPAPLAAVGVAALGAVLALFWCAAAALAHRLGNGPAARAFLFSNFLLAAEWLRGPGLADFGWLSPGQMLVDTPLSGWAPVLGEFGMALWLFWGAAGAAVFLSSFEGAQRLSAGSAARAVSLAPAFLGAAAGWGLQAVDWSVPGRSVDVRLAQADLPVVDAFTRADPAERIARTADLLEKPWSEAAGVVRLALTPEGILLTDPKRLDESSRAAFERLLAAADAPVLFNGFRTPAPGDWRNTAYFRRDAQSALTYVDKRKLVPFGEFVPAGFRWFVDLLGVPLADLTPGSWMQKNFAFAGLSIGPLICYENIDGEVLRSLWRDGEGPDFLAVTANLGWFGQAVVPQHLAMTRLRALESARPALSVNMNGLSSVVGPKGEILALAPEHGAALLEARVRASVGAPTPFVAAGNAPALALAGLGILLSWCAGRRTRRRSGPRAGCEDQTQPQQP